MTETIVPIGRIETPWARVEDCPCNIDPAGPPCRLLLEPRFAPGLDGLAAGDLILVLYWLGGADRNRLQGVSRRTGRRCGAFARRTPHRPNPIGAAAVRIEAIGDGTLTVRGLDCVDGTPLVDIKPAMMAERPAPE